MANYMFEQFFEKMKEIGFGEDVLAGGTSGEYKVSEQQTVSGKGIDVDIKYDMESRQHKEFVIALNESAKRRLEQLNNLEQLSATLTAYILTQEASEGTSYNKSSSMDKKSMGNCRKHDDTVTKQLVEQKIHRLLSYIHEGKFLELEMLLAYYSR